MLPFHMRTNKYIDRSNFSELLRCAFKFKPAAKYIYVSLSGLMAADQKAFYRRFDFKKQISIEGSESTYKRQLFNSIYNSIEYINAILGDFISDLDNNLKAHVKPASAYKSLSKVFWLDYTEPSKRGQQLDDIYNLMSNAVHADIIKVTMNAGVDTLAIDPSIVIESEKREAKFDALKKQLGDYMPSGYSPSEFKSEQMALILWDAIRDTALKGLNSDGSYILFPLNCHRYTDVSHQMVSGTFIVLQADKQEAFLKKSQVTEWAHYCDGWSKIQKINLPFLTDTERAQIDKSLPQMNIDEIASSLGFLVGDSLPSSLKALDEYKKYHKNYPYFAPVGEF